MGFQDHWGNNITGAEEATAAAVSDFTEGLIKFDKKAGRVVGAAKKDPGSAIANAYAAMLMMFLEMQNSPEVAGDFLRNAEAAVGGATDREKRTVSIARRWVERDIPGVVAEGKELLDL